MEKQISDLGFEDCPIMDGSEYEQFLEDQQFLERQLG